MVLEQVANIQPSDKDSNKQVTGFVARLTVWGLSISQIPSLSLKKK